MDTAVQIISGATVVTVDRKRRVLRNGAVAVAGGRIIDVGPDATVRLNHPNAKIIEAQGQMVLPGFVNLHVHSALTITRGIIGDLGGAPAYRRDIPQGVLLSPDDTYIMSLLGGLQALRFGSTTIVENYIHARSNIRALAELGIRAVVSERIHDADLFSVRQGEYEYDRALGQSLLDENAALIDEWNGYEGGRIACCVGPHGPDTASTDLLMECQRLAESKGVGIVIHLAQSAGEVAQVRQRTGRSSVQHLAEIGLLGPQLIAGHCAFLDPGDAELLAESGTHVCQLPVVNAKSGWVAPVEEMRRCGANVGLGTDHMLHDMIEAMRMALCVNRVSDGDPRGIRAMDVLEMATINGARAIGRESELGSIEAGKIADLILIRIDSPHFAPILDPVANLIYAGLSSDIQSVMIGGKFVVRDGVVLTVDAATITARAQARAEALWMKVSKWRPGDYLDQPVQ